MSPIAKMNIACAIQGGLFGFGLALAGYDVFSHFWVVVPLIIVNAIISVPFWRNYFKVPVDK